MNVIFSTSVLTRIPKWLYVRTYVPLNLPEFLSDFFDIAYLTLFLPGECHAQPDFFLNVGPFLGKKSLKMAQKSTFSKYGHVICRKAFLMLISDFEFALPDFGFLVPGENVNYYINHILVYNLVANSDVCSQSSDQCDEHVTIK